MTSLHYVRCLIYNMAIIMPTPGGGCENWIYVGHLCGLKCFNFLLKSIKGLSSFCFMEKIRGYEVYLINSFSKMVSCPYHFLQVALIQRPWDLPSCQIQLPPFHPYSICLLCCMTSWRQSLKRFTSLASLKPLFLVHFHFFSFLPLVSFIAGV